MVITRCIWILTFLVVIFLSGLLFGSPALAFVVAIASTSKALDVRLRLQSLLMHGHFHAPRYLALLDRIPGTVLL